MSKASLDYSDLINVDVWLCSKCDQVTYDEAGHEPPDFCCRCGERFEECE